MFEQIEAPNPRAAQLARAELCHCAECVRVREGDKRDARLMLRATQIAGAGVTPAERVSWDAYIAARHEFGGYLPATARHD